MLPASRHRLVLPLLLLASHLGWSQSNPGPVEITTTKYPDAVLVEARNTTAVPYTVLINFDLLNMYPSAKLPIRKVVEPGKKKVVLVRLTPSPGQRFQYRSEYNTYLGNTLAPPTGRGFVYQLPFEAGQPYRLIQGNNGPFSHAGKYAFDFSMPEGTVVCAARAGIVSQVKQDSDTGCLTRDCADQGNYITVFHDDGSFAKYVHLRLHGSLVEVGQRVAAGQPLGHSGNTGWSSGPHLHFQVDVPGEPMSVSVPVTFSINGQPLADLVSGTSYGR